MKRILVVEDDPAVVIGLSDFVRSLGYEVLIARDGEQALTLFRSERPDLVLLDLVLPKRSGSDVCRTIRGEGYTTPVIMVTAKSQPQDRVAGLDLGADDYVAKPFDLSELAARIRAVMRRAEGASAEREAVHEIASIRIDLGQFCIERDGQRFDLPKRECEILSLLLARRGEVVTRNEILDAVWGPDKFPSTRTVDNYIVSLRRKLEEDPADPQLLLSIRSAGYRLADG